jgi:uncharacterized protein YcaQ
MEIIQIESPQQQARIQRIALAAQGLLKNQPYGRGIVGARNTINHIGYVQIDTISVVERAHHHVLFSRVPNFKPAMTNQMLVDGDIFEYWSHAAAFLPINDFRFSLPYKHAIKSGQTHWHRNPDKKLMGQLLARIHSEGPLRSRDIEQNDSLKRTGWWDWKPAKKALEQLYMQGDLMVSSREGFQKVYDITERVLPFEVNTQMPTIDEFAAHMLKQQLRCHGLVSLKGITYLRRNTALRKAVKKLVYKKLAQGELQQIQVNNGEIFVLKRSLLEQPLPRLNNRILILSPFDNCVIQRERLKSLFQYDYQIECYVPEPKRQYGYFSLPLLFRDTFIGRMDCKAHRKDGHLEIKNLHFEQHYFDVDIVINALAESINHFIIFQQCKSVSLVKVHPNHLTKIIQNTLDVVKRE